MASTTRIYVTEPDTDSDSPEETRRRAGFFTEESAKYWRGSKGVFDGSNLADVNTRDANRGQGLYRTAQGRWVLSTWSNWQGEPDTHSYITESDARDWLLFNDEDEAAEKYFGEIESERGPGHPEVGNPVHVRLGDLLARVDKFAASEGCSRAEAVRRLVLIGLAHEVEDDDE